MHFLRSHFTLVSSSIFLTGLSAVAASASLGLIGPWEAAELAACGALLAVCTYLALILRRLVGDTAAARAGGEAQNRELTQVARESRGELSARMDGLVERLAKAADLVAEARGSEPGGTEPGRSPERSAAPSEVPETRVASDGDRDSVRDGTNAPAEATS